MEQSNLLQALKDSSTYEGDVDSVDIIQTHISFVALTGEYAYKIKKPVNFGFLDFSTLEKRKYFCEQEVKLNKRLCPEIYEKVVPIIKENNHIQIGGKGKIVDYAVKMREFPQDNIITNLLHNNRIDEQKIEDIVDRLVDFYSEEKSTDEIKKFGEIKVIKQNTDENFEQTKSFIGEIIDKHKFDYIKKITNDFLKKKKNVFEERIKNNYIKDCHGDLHTGNIVLINDEICIFDCIEFNKRFRYSDVASDIGFLSMDLDFQGSPYLSSYLIEKYVEKSKDKGIYDVLNFYKAYRAYVRGKVTGFKLSDPNINKEEKQDIKDTTKKYFDLAYYYILLVSHQIEKDAKCLLFITSGLTGTGKTTVARKISVDYNAKVISTDSIRKELAGINKYERHHEEYNTGLYSPEKMLQTYEKVLEKAGEQLINNQNVVLDATFKSKELRDKAEQKAKKHNACFLILFCNLPDIYVKKYLEERVKKKSISDGRWEIYLKQQKDFDPVIDDDNYVKIDISKKNYDYQINMFTKILEKVCEG